MPGPVGGGCLIRLPVAGRRTCISLYLGSPQTPVFRPARQASSGTEGDAIRGMPDGQAPRLPSLPQPAARPAGHQNWTEGAVRTVRAALDAAAGPRTRWPGGQPVRPALTGTDQRRYGQLGKA